MKLTDIQQLHTDGFLSTDQRDRITAHYKLEDSQSKFMIILSVLGGALVASGVILLIASNWQDIPRLVKLFCGLALMLGAHAGGIWIQQRSTNYPKVAEALHLIGSGLLLGNIALIGQIYNLSSRPPNAILLWWLGIVALPWILRSKAQHILSLIVFLVWLGMEMVEPHGWFHGVGNENILLFYPSILLGLYAGGLWLERSSYLEFASSTQKLGLLGFLAFNLPLIWGWRWEHEATNRVLGIFLLLVVGVAALLFLRLREEQRLPREWRYGWPTALVFWLLLSGLSGFFFQGHKAMDSELAWFASIALFIHCLVQVNVGLLLGSPFLINFGIAFLAIDVVTAYIRLFGTMAMTGAMFIVSGVGLIVLGVVLEKRRRKLLRQLAENQTPTQS